MQSNRRGHLWIDIARGVRRACRNPIILNSLLVFFVAFSANAHDYVYAISGSVAAPLTAQDSGIDLIAKPVTEWAESCRLRLRFLDRETDEPSPALVRVYDETGRRVVLKDLLSRATAYTEGNIGPSSFVHMNSWSMVPDERTVEVPQAVLTIEAFHGPNSVRFTETIDLRGKSEAEVEGRIPRLLPAAYPWYSGNAHLHLQKMTLDEAERYACETAAGDGYDLVFLSYLERAEADAHYISNTFTAEDLARFSQRSGVVFGYGEEYRHNFEGNSEGYGHVMFLDLKQLILPASLGYAITRSSNDGIPLRDGIVQAREQNGTVLWCHGTQGFEDIPNWFAGLVDVQMIFDQGSRGTYETALYRYLNAGLRVPLATGTDWFFRDMAMAYVQMDEPLTKERWLEALRAGRSFITNGPLVTFTVNGKPAGTVIDAAPGDALDIAASIVCRGDFNDLELVRNGHVVARANAVKHDGRYVAEFKLQIAVSEPSWFAVRATPFSANYDKPEDFDTGFNEYGKPLFTHSSPVYVDVDGQGVFVPESVQSLLDEVRANRSQIADEGDFSTPEARERVLDVYGEALGTLQAHLPATE